MIDLKPNPLDIPSPKASDIVRNWPRAMWGECYGKIIFNNGKTEFCAIGILCEVGGFEWGEPSNKTLDHVRWGASSSSRAQEFVRQRYGLTKRHMRLVTEANDFFGKDRAADYLASLGL